MSDIAGDVIKSTDKPSPTSRPPTPPLTPRPPPGPPPPLTPISSPSSRPSTPSRLSTPPTPTSGRPSPRSLSPHSPSTSSPKFFPSSSSSSSSSPPRSRTPSPSARKAETPVSGAKVVSDPERDSHDQIVDLLQGKRVRTSRTPFADSRGNSLPAGVTNLNSQFFEDLKRNTYLFNDKMMVSKDESAAVKKDLSFAFCDSLIRKFGVNGFNNLSLLLTQAASMDLAVYLMGIHQPHYVTAENTTYHIKTTPEGMVSVTIDSTFAIRDPESSRCVGNQRVVREISLTQEELQKDFNTSGETPAITVKDTLGSLSPPTAEQIKEDERRRKRGEAS